MNNKPWYEKLGIWIGIIAGIVTIIVGIPAIFKIINEYNLNSKTSNDFLQAELDNKIKALGEEVELLDLQLHQIARNTVLKNAEENKIDVSKELDYHTLISILQELQPYYYFTHIVSYMEDNGYDVENYKISIINEQFFRMSYDKQADVLSQMFIPYEHTYKVATDYNYYADITQYEDHTEYSNVTAEATKIEERTLVFYLCKELMENPFGLIPRTEENKDIIYQKSTD